MSELIEVTLVGGPHNGESVHVFEGTTLYSRDSLRGHSKTVHQYKMQSETVFTYDDVVSAKQAKLILIDVDTALKTPNGFTTVNSFIHDGWTVGCIGTGRMAELRAWLAANNLHNLEPVISLPENSNSAEVKADMIDSFLDSGTYQQVTLIDGNAETVKRITEEFGPKSALLYNNTTGVPNE